MKKMCIILALFLTLLVISGCSGNRTVKPITEEEAILKVIVDNLDFPSNTKDIIAKSIPIGGRPGTTVSVKFTTEAEKINDTTYNITLIKDWGMTFNNNYIKCFWKYEVTPDMVKLIDSENNEHLIPIMK